MTLKVSAHKAAEVAIESIGRGYETAIDLRSKYCKGNLSDSRLIEIDEHGGREIVSPGGISIPNVSKSIKCKNGEPIRFRSDVLSFQQLQVDVGQRPVTGVRLYLEGRSSNSLSIHLQHLSSLPNVFQPIDDPNGNYP